MSKARAVALISYTAEAEDELTFMQNDVISIQSTKGGHWWYGLLNGRKGCVPKKFLELQVLDKYKVIRPHLASKQGDLKLEENAIVDVLIKENSEWFGKIGESEGWFPRECVTLATQEDTPPVLARTTTRAAFDEISQSAMLIDDPRKGRPKKPAVRKPDHRLSKNSSSSDEDEAYDLPHIPSRELKPQPQQQPRMDSAFLNDLKSKLKRHNSNSNNADDAPSNLAKATSKSNPNLTSTGKEDKLSFKLFSPKPFMQNKLARNSKLSEEKDLEKRVEHLEQLVKTMEEQLSEILRELTLRK